MKTALLIPFLLALAPCPVFAQMAPEAPAFAVVFYNVENLFDTLDDPRTADGDFTPTGPLGWTGRRYRQKLLSLYKTFVAVGEWAPPGLIGLCEVEDRRTLVDLLRHTPLRREGYGIVCEPSADPRGIETALLYRPAVFRYLCHERLRPRFAFDTLARTRDVLYVAGELPGGDTLHVFVNHWPSRRGGQATSEPRRIAVAQRVRAAVDSLLAENADALVLLMGDLNDTPLDRSVAAVLRARTDGDRSDPSSLHERVLPTADGTGTHKHEGEWAILDHLIVSGALLEGSGGRWQMRQGAPFTASFLLENDFRHTGQRPRRTYAGPRYLGGYSDHLPVRARLEGKVRN
jgi:endonuclease/exonuclease/phosphatase family metal-dependent hydrolase